MQNLTRTELEPEARCIQEYLEGEKLVDGMLRRVRALATKAGQDPDETLGLIFRRTTRVPQG